jgi:signal transduction histidine kinase
VADNGSGIPQKEKQKVFQKFYRLGNEETRHAKGTGLGLYLTKYIAENHGGTISVHDNHPQGSVFEIRFVNKSA